MYSTRPAAGAYPRLFFTASDLPALRAKLEHPDCVGAWTRLLAGCEQMLLPNPAPLCSRHVRAPHLAFAYLVTGREAFAAKARELAMAIVSRETWTSPGDGVNNWRAGLGTGGAIRQTALAYDWARDALSEDDRHRFRAAILEKGLTPCLEDIRAGARCAEWYTCNGMCVINGPATLAAILLAEEADTREVFDLCSTQIRRAVAAHCPDGGYPEGLLYWNYGIRHMLMAVEPLRRLKGVNLYDEPFLHNTCDYALHGIHPWMTHCTNTADSSCLTRLWPPIAALAAYHKRPEWQWLARRLLTRDWGNDGEALEYSLFYLIYYEPDLPAAPPVEEKRDQLFSGLQQISLRSDWTDDAIHAMWLNGPSNCHHNHLHLNSFSIAARGERLLIDMGQFDYADYQDYRRLTVGHNTLLVDGEGQIITTDEDIWCRRIRAGQWGTVFGEFHCLREEAGAVIATGSVVNAYAGRLRTFDRTLAFVDRQFFFLHDSIELEQAPPVALEWHFHSGGEVELSEQGARFSSGAARLALRFCGPQPVEQSVATAPHELARPGAPVRRLDLRASCTGRTFDLFALLVPFRAGAEPDLELGVVGEGVVFSVCGERRHYEPLSRKLRRDNA